MDYRQKRLLFCSCVKRSLPLHSCKRDVRPSTMPKEPFSLFEYFSQEANARLTLAYPSASEAERFVVF